MPTPSLVFINEASKAQAGPITCPRLYSQCKLWHVCKPQPSSYKLEACSLSLATFFILAGPFVNPGMGRSELYPAVGFFPSNNEGPIIDPEALMAASIHAPSIFTNLCADGQEQTWNCPERSCTSKLPAQHSCGKESSCWRLMKKVGCWIGGQLENLNLDDSCPDLV